MPKINILSLVGDAGICATNSMDLRFLGRYKSVCSAVMRHVGKSALVVAILDRNNIVVVAFLALCTSAAHTPQTSSSSLIVRKDFRVDFTETN